MLSDLKIDDLEDMGRRCFCLQSRMTARAITRAYNSALSPCGLEVTEFSLLVAVAWGKETSISSLATRMAFERSTLVRNLSRMANLGLIKSLVSQGRGVKYGLTAKGRSMLEKGLPLWVRAQAAVEKEMNSVGTSELLAQFVKLRKAAKKIG